MNYSSWTCFTSLYVDYHTYSWWLDSIVKFSYSFQWSALKSVGENIMKLQWGLCIWVHLTCGGENASNDATESDEKLPEGHVLLGDFDH